MQGKIIKGVGGLYLVAPSEGTDNLLYTCTARGLFRYQKIKPAIGDRVEFEKDEADGKPDRGSIVKILPRTNLLLRPTVANVDQAMLVMACSRPEPNYNLVDRFLISLKKREVPILLCFNKCELIDEAAMEHCRRIYENSGCKVLFMSALTGFGIAEATELLRGKTTALAGPSGVGKSSFVNAVFPEAGTQTGGLSEKIARGKHTTRHSELMRIAEDTYLCDTPGFSSLFLEESEPETLRDYYPEFEPYESGCKFTGCVHVKERDCKVKEAALRGDIARERYENYVLIYEELKRNKKY
ncbi:MAG: ribosome small subunit-dependent GTPase A [Lachnospiraceae bacterium]|nr:ribosome small subunit-dependent GTPase A [Lachnospiraceae bacterium]